MKTFINKTLLFLFKNLNDIVIILLCIELITVGHWSIFHSIVAALSLANIGIKYLTKNG